jgi:high-affinity nickel permease
MTNAAIKLSEHDNNYFKYSEDITNLPFISNWILSWGIKVGKKYKVLIRNKNGFKNVLYTNSAELINVNKVLLLFNHTYLNEKKFIGLNILAQLKDKHYFDADVFIMFDNTMSSLMSDKDFTVDYFYIG